eukprot:COSAG05_NODE_414_length_10051_cov_120.012158_9_plen_130_part_00
MVSLELNGDPIGSPKPGGQYDKSMPTFQAKFAPGTLTAKAMAADGKTVLATHAVNSWGQATAVKLSMDVPSVATGTGTAVPSQRLCFKSSPDCVAESSQQMTAPIHSINILESFISDLGIKFVRATENV